MPGLRRCSRLAAAIEDGHRFVTQWGKQAEALGWAPADLFGFARAREAGTQLPTTSPLRPDGLDLERARPARDRADATAATILAPSGASLMYHRYDKPAPGLIGDSTDGRSGRGGGLVTMIMPLPRYVRPRRTCRWSGRFLLDCADSLSQARMHHSERAAWS